MAQAVRFQFGGAGWQHVVTRDDDGKWPQYYQKYCLVDNANLQIAADAIQNFRLATPNHFFTFNFDTIQNTLRENNVLVITLNAVSLCNSLNPDEWCRPKLRDGFTELTPTDPVTCDKNHVFEMNRLLIWANSRGNNQCPFVKSNGRVHEFRNIRVHVGTQNEIGNARLEGGRIRQLTDQVALTRLHTLRTITPSMKHEIASLSSDAAKVVIKLGGVAAEIIIRETIKIVGKQALLNGAKYALKYLPFVGALVGAAMAGYRIYLGITTGDKSQFVKAAFEAVSGAACFIPGAGIGISALIDLGIAGHDIYALKQASNKTELASLSDAYIGLGLPPEPEPTEEQARQAYREISRIVHPDRAAQNGEYNQQLNNEIQQNLNRCKDYINRNKGWNI